MRGTSIGALCALAALGGAAPAAEAAVVSSDGTTLVYTASAGKVNVIDISRPAPGTIRVTPDTGDADPLSPTAPCAPAGGGAVDCPATRVVADTFDGEDEVSAMGLQAPVTARGGDDADFVVGGRANDALDGGPGDDVLYGWDPSNPESGADRLDGGTGDDHFVVPAGADEVIGGAGLDRVSFLASDLNNGAPVDHRYTLDDQPDDGPAGSGMNIRADVEDAGGYLTRMQEGAGIDVFGGYQSTIAGLPATEGTATVRGNAGLNSLLGGTGSDDLDGGPNNDALSGGDGSDILRSVDGFADRLMCGPGTDVALADTLDVVSPTCETVERTAVAAAPAPAPGPAPAAGDDRPPSVAFTAPLGGAQLGPAPTQLVAEASDDRGISSVQFLDDDRIVCTDTTPPYTCEYAPRGGDVGRNTMSVMAIDTAQQTATAFRVFTVGRFAPRGVDLRVRRARVRRGTRFTATGRVVAPARVERGSACLGGFVALQVKRGRRTISNRRVKLTASCSFTSTVTFRRASQSLRFVAVYAGNVVMNARRSRVVSAQ